MNGQGFALRAVRDRAVALFGIDLRSLALFRISAALLILFDLASRARLLETNYTDFGAQPRSAAVAYFEPGLLPSLHMLAGSVRYELALFVLAALAAVLLLVGYRTLVATALSWLLLDSLHSRNALVLDGGDHLLRHLLFWSLFLPLGARWSLDARRRGAPLSSLVCSPASAALLLQAAGMFLLTGLLKTGPEWSDGTAIQYALSRRWWLNPFGAWLLAHPELLRLMTPAVRWFELLAPFTLFVPVYTAQIRLLMIPVFWGFMGGLGLGLALNLFPWISGLGLLPFVPAFVWDKLGAAAGPGASGAEERASPARRAVSRAAQTAVLALLVLMLFVAAGHVDERLSPPPALRDVANRLHMKQGWSMYAPSPRHVDVWFEHRGRLVNGAPVNLDRATGGETWTAHVNRAWQDYRFKYYLQKLADPKWEPQVTPYAQWLCGQWNADRTGGARLDWISISSVVEPISLGGEPAAPADVRPLFAGACPP
jgi:Vitamin K-dependent gamma-carboxylase